MQYQLYYNMNFLFSLNTDIKELACTALTAQLQESQALMKVLINLNNSLTKHEIIY